MTKGGVIKYWGGGGVEGKRKFIWKISPPPVKSVDII